MQHMQRARVQEYDTRLKKEELKAAEAKKDVVTPWLVTSSEESALEMCVPAISTEPRM